MSLGRILGSLMYHLNRNHRRIALRNLEFINPHWSPSEIRRFAIRVFHHFGTTIMELIRMTCLSQEENLKMIQIKGEEHVLQALRKNRGLIVISAHFGNWEIGLQLYPLYLNVSMLGVIQDFKPEFLNSWLQEFRTRFGNRFIHKRGALNILTQTLRSNGAVALMIDMTRQKQSVPVTFLGRKATATPAAALLALRCKSPVVPTFCFREDDGSITLCFEPSVPIRQTNDLRADLQFNTQTMTDIIEQTIKRRSEQWFWMQRRWKAFYPDLYLDYFAARKRHKVKKIKKRKSRMKEKVMKWRKRAAKSSSIKH